MIELEKNKEKFASMPERQNEKAGKNLIHLQSKNITRFETNDPTELAIMVSQSVWPATNEKNRPGTIILAAVNSWQLILASSNLIHHPNNGPILLVPYDHLPSSIINEIERLQPKGNSNGTQIKVIGDVSEKLLDTLNNYKIEQIKDDDPASFAAEVDRFYAEVSGKFPENILIVSSQDKAKAYSIIAGYWIAHMPEPILFVTEDDIPELTKKAIEKREQPHLYVVGPSSIISHKVEEKLQELGKVTRIEGNNAEGTSIAFTTFKDSESGFGWGINNPGHGFSFISYETPELGLITTPFAHLGKHVPLLYLQDGKLSNEMTRYLAKVKPTFSTSPMSGPYNHGFIFGSLTEISYDLQGTIDSKLEIEQADGHGHGIH